ncbi:MAG: group II intron reverse transcriptase/maturase [Planctomycetaceae bacterium]|nr:MAG: group II intron reverse transcriptase/maturase [Planctomycetaceae bacterium]
MSTTTLPMMNAASPAQPSPNQALLEIQRQIFWDTHHVTSPADNLMRWIIHPDNLAAAWAQVRRSEGANTPGPDGVTCDQLKHRIGPWLNKLAEDLLQQRYTPQMPRVVEIPKPHNPEKTRRISILTVRDRVVQCALKQVLEPILEPRFLNHSFGFRPGRNVLLALYRALDALHSTARKPSPYRWALPLDIKDCFPSLDHQHLLTQLQQYVTDRQLLSIVASCLDTWGETTNFLWFKRRVGIPQGGALSPLLCNLALHPVDQAIHHHAREHGQSVMLLRYADDLLLLARDRTCLYAAQTVLKKELAKQSLKLGPYALPCDTYQGFEWLGMIIKPKLYCMPETVDYGLYIPEAKVQEMIDVLNDMTRPPSDKLDQSTFNLARWITSINDQLRSWRQSCFYAENAPQVFSVLDEIAFERIGRLLRLSTGESLSALRKQYLLKLPRGYKTWCYNGVQLSVLSSLAPQRPEIVLHKPRWWAKRMAPSQNNANPVPLQGL